MTKSKGVFIGGDAPAPEGLTFYHDFVEERLQGPHSFPFRLDITLSARSTSFGATFPTTPIGLEWSALLKEVSSRHTNIQILADRLPSLVRKHFTMAEDRDFAFTLGCTLRYFPHTAFQDSIAADFPIIYLGLSDSLSESATIHMGMQGRQFIASLFAILASDADESPLYPAIATEGRKFLSGFLCGYQGTHPLDKHVFSPLRDFIERFLLEQGFFFIPDSKTNINNFIYKLGRFSRIYSPPF